MKKLFVVVGLVLSLVAQAGPTQHVKSLIRDLKRTLHERQARSSGQPLLRIEASEVVQQGVEFNAFIHPVSSYAGSYVVVDATLDNSAVTLEHPAADLWVFSAPQFEKIASHTLSFTVSLENASQADQISSALTAVQQQIQSLQTQIANTTDPNQLAHLNALLNQQIALQSQLTNSLAGLKNPLGTQKYSFSVAPAPSDSTSFPRITSVTPDVGSTAGGTALSISGANFTAGASVSIGGVVATNVVVVNSTNITAIAPAFASDGAEDVVVTLPLAAGDQEQKNAKLTNGYYATSVALGSNVPVAVTGATQSINFGGLATLHGDQSTAVNGHALAYAWSLIAAPVGSGLPLNSTIGTSSNISVTPDFPGNFVYQLVVTDTTTNVSSAPSLTVVQVLAGTNHAPVLSVARPMMTYPQWTTTLQLGVSDESWQAHSYWISRAPSSGTASVSSSGLLSYTAGASTGVDSFDVMVVDNGTPPLTTSITVPVTIVANQPPVASAPPITVAPGVPGTSQVNGYDRSGQTVTFALSAQPANGAATISSLGLVTYTSNAGYSGTDSIGVVVTDSESPPLSTSISIPVTVSSLTPPVLPSVVGYSVFTNVGVPYLLGMGFRPFSGAPAIQYSNGGAASVVWDFGDGTHESIADLGYAGINHYYVDPGSYTAVMTATDKAGLTSSVSIPVTVSSNNIEIPVVRVTMTPATGGASPLTVSFDASGSTYGGGISGYRWQFCGQNPEIFTTTPTITHTFTATCGVRVRAIASDSRALGQANLTVPVGATTAGALPAAQYTVAPAREQLVGSTFNFDSSRSFDLNVGGALTNFFWNLDGACPTCTATGPSTSYAYSQVLSRFPGLTVTNSLGLSGFASIQIWTVQALGTHAPHALISASGTRGVAPFTVTLSTAPSYGYDGASIVNTVWNFADGTPSQTGTTVTHTFTTQGAYNVLPDITDSNGNTSRIGQVITVTGTSAELASIRTPSYDDPDRENQRGVLSASCADGSGAACYALSQMFAEDGDSFTANELKAKACSKGYQPACSSREGSQVRAGVPAVHDGSRQYVAGVHL